SSKTPPPQKYTIFPSRPSSDLLHGPLQCRTRNDEKHLQFLFAPRSSDGRGYKRRLILLREYRALPSIAPLRLCWQIAAGLFNGRDRKSTRLNSSYVKISYAVFG